MLRPGPCGFSCTEDCDTGTSVLDSYKALFGEPKEDASFKPCPERFGYGDNNEVSLQVCVPPDPYTKSEQVVAQLSTDKAVTDLRKNVNKIDQKSKQLTDAKGSKTNGKPTKLTKEMREKLKAEAWKEHVRKAMVPLPLPARSIELRRSKLFIGCDCLKRNGMQDSCPLRGCQGSSDCMEKPHPGCKPSGLYSKVTESATLEALEPKPGKCPEMNLLPEVTSDSLRSDEQLNYVESARRFYKSKPCQRIDLSKSRLGRKRPKGSSDIGCQTQDLQIL